MATHNLAEVQEITQGLAKLLADSYTLYLKTQGFHWNVTGIDFYSFHKMFEEQYLELAGAIDIIAERIRALGVQAPASYAQFLKLTRLKEEISVPTAEKMVTQLLTDHEMVQQTITEVFPHAEQAGDEATIDLLNDRMGVHEKTAWMLRSILQK